MRYDPNIKPRAPVADRSTVRSMLRGWRGRCPNCGGGPIYTGYLKVRRSCAACGEHLHHHRADDLPAYAVIIIVGKLLIAGLFAVEMAWAPPVWVHWAVWPAATLLLALWLLPRVKGTVIGMQWALGMHGFGEEREDPVGAATAGGPDTGQDQRS